MNDYYAPNLGNTCPYCGSTLDMDGLCSNFDNCRERAAAELSRIVGPEIRRELAEESAKAPCSVCGRPTGGCCTVAVPPKGIFLVGDISTHDILRCKCHAEERRRGFDKSHLAIPILGGVFDHKPGCRHPDYGPCTCSAKYSK